MPDHEQPPDKTDISRRGFLKGVGAGAVATGFIGKVSTPRAAGAQAKDGVQGPGEVSVTLNVNGESKKLSVEPRVTLLDALRNSLDTTGSKKVCDRGTCGACSVLCDDKLIYSCSMLAVEAQGHKITTVEGLGSPEQMSKVQELFVDHDALQCGFCTPGFVVATTAFVRANPNATLEQVRDGLGGNLCRCGTYVGIMEVAMEAAKGGA